MLGTVHPTLAAHRDPRPILGVRLAGPLLALATVLAFSTALQAGFVAVDDADYVTRNRQIQQGLTLETVHYAFSGFRVWNWHPITMLSHALDCAFYGLNPVGHHLTSVLLHVLNAVLLYLFLARTTQRPGRAALVAALFALHPLRVESVAWISERKDVLSATFFFLMLLTWSQYAASPRLRFWLVAACLLALGLMAKAMLVTAPFVLLLLEWWPLGRPSGPRSLLDKLPLLALCASASVLTVLAQGAAVASLAARPLSARIVNAAESYFKYLGKTLWPVDLSIFYPLPLRVSATLGLAAFAGIGFALTAAFALRRRFPALLVGLCWFLGMLVPTIGLVQVGSQAIADRYTYLPQIGLFIALVYSLPAPRPALIAPSTAFVAGVLGLLAFLTARQCRVWISTDALFKQADRVAGDNFFVQGALGNLEVENGRYAEGEARFRQALRMNPADEMSLANLGALLVREGRNREALPLLLQAEKVEPDETLILGRLAVALARLGRLDEALARYRWLLSRPHQAEVEGDYAVALALKGRASEALAILQHAVSADPDNARLHFNFGTFLSQQGRFAEAVPEFREALRLDPSIPGIASSLSNAMEDAGSTPRR